MFDAIIWGADNTCIHCGKKIKYWQAYVRPSTYVIHEKCFEDYMAERKKGVPRNKNKIELITEEVLNRTKKQKKEMKIYDKSVECGCNKYGNCSR